MPKIQKYIHVQIMFMLRNFIVVSLVLVYIFFGRFVSFIYTCEYGKNTQHYGHRRYT